CRCRLGAHEIEYFGVLHQGVHATAAGNADQVQCRTAGKRGSRLEIAARGGAHEFQVLPDHMQAAAGNLCEEVEGAGEVDELEAREDEEADLQGHGVSPMLLTGSFYLLMLWHE